jgi:DNA (cytosine-5)-methyltransferase 1
VTKAQTSRPLNGHLDPSLSELDLAMIRSIPPGGNWKDIPTSIPSLRLEQIRRMAAERGMVRTSYYGRLRSDQPAYTIATYYDRPGNGTNIHPWEHRTISHREAARLQSFPDSYEFCGSKASVKRQIGNAVPPLLAYALGRQIGKCAFVDLFAGAGGLSFGLELAGLRAAVAQELDRSFASTYALNHPDTTVIGGDVREASVKRSLLDAVSVRVKNNDVILVGGPPCQGFSMAGWRSKVDARNSLADEFLDILVQVRPRLFVFENVEGLLSMDKGCVIQDLLSAFRLVGYNVAEPWLAYCEQFGVPQMRRRLIIIGSRDRSDMIGIPDTHFDRCRGRRESAGMRSSHRYPITVGEAFAGLPPLRKVLKKFYPSGDSDLNYSKWATLQISPDEFLDQRGSRRSGAANRQLPLLH